MSRILSWKINSDKYAYLFKIPGTDSHISDRLSPENSIWDDSSVIEYYTCNEDTYKDAFASMSGEVLSTFAVTIPYKENYFTENNGTGGTIVLLSGADGISGDKNISTNDIGAEVYDQFNKLIDERLAIETAKILEQNKAVKDSITAKTQETISKAIETIEKTQEQLNNVRADLEVRLSGATSALTMAASLFELNGAINAEDIQNVFGSIHEYDEWMDKYSGCVEEIKYDYDKAKEMMGTIGEAEDVTMGMFSKFASSLSVLNQTVGAVESTMNASEGTIKDIASWYNINASSVTEASSFINAMSGQITNTINFIQGDDFTSTIRREMDAQKASIKDEVLAETNSALTNVTREMNAISGQIIDSITMMTSDSALTSMGHKMDALESTMDEWMTKTDSAMSITSDLREQWSISSGKISSVSTLMAETDADGNIMYFASGETSYEERVFKNSQNQWVGSISNQIWDDKWVYVHFSNVIASYIQQQSSAITLSVMGDGDVTAAIKAAIEGDKSIITMIANEVVIDANMIAKAISAKTANIGGILLGDGQVKCMATKNDKPLFLLDGKTGKLYAQDAEITGSITATSLTLGGGETIDDYINNRIPSETPTIDDITGIVSGYLKSEEFEKILGDQGYVTQGSFDEWVEKQSGLTIDEVSAICKTLIGAEINFPSGTTSDGSGGTVHTISIGGKQYSWTTIDGGNFLVLDKQLSGNSGTTIISKDGLLQANNAIIYGEIHAQKGSIGSLTLNNGGLYGDNFKLNNDGLILRGSIRQPFTTLRYWYTWDEDEKDMDNLSDNYYLPVGGHSLPALRCDVSQIGRRIIIVNNEYGVHQSFSVSTMTLPTGFYFYEDGFQSTSLSICNELIELLGYGNIYSAGTENKREEFFGWIVLKRQNIMTKRMYGHELRALCTGTLNMNSGTISQLVSCDGTTYISNSNTTNAGNTSTYWSGNGFSYISTKKSSDGSSECYIRLPDRWFNGGNTDNIMVQLTPFKTLCNCCYKNVTNKGFTIESSNVNANINFTIYNRGDWSTLPEITDVSLSISQSYISFDYDDYGVQNAKTITVKVSPSNGNITYTTYDKYGRGCSAFVCDMDENSNIFTVYPARQETSSTANAMCVEFKLINGSTTRTTILTINQNGYFDDSDFYYS